MTRFSLCLLLMLGSLAGGAAQEGEPIGRLFFTPAERSALDAGKSARKSAPVAQGSRTVQLNGVVMRSDSERTVWVNGKAYHGGSPDGIQIKTDPAAPGVAAIRAPGANSNASVKLRVGQRLESTTGKVTEPYVTEPYKDGVAEASASGNATIGASARQGGPGTPSKTDKPSAKPPEH